VVSRRPALAHRELQQFKPGIGLLLEHFQVPVVPVVIHGTREAMPPGKTLPRPKKVTVEFGRALEVEELERRGEGESPQEQIVQALRDRIGELWSAGCNSSVDRVS
jgi:long-chain acyl-CoA synthetase